MKPCCYIVSMAFSYRYFFLLFAAFVLLSCEQKQSENVIEFSSDVTQSFEGFVRDTNAYVMVVDTSVHDSVFNEKIVPVKTGGFFEFFSKESNENGTNGLKVFYAYSDSINPFVKGFSVRPTFLDVVSLAYAKHYSMEISPDDIWLVILDGVRIHVKNNREKLKDKFVAPGTDTVVTVIDNSLTQESTHREWFWTISNLFDSLQVKLPEKTGIPLKTKFSTTSPVDNNISRTMTMAVASQYYTYMVSTLCGIPKIKVIGTKDDWMLLKDSFNKLTEQLDMKWWADGLNPVLDEFINIFDGKINLEHWKGIYKFHKPEFCGYPDFNGWISRFFPYIDNGESLIKHTDWDKRIDLRDVPKGITSVDLKWNYLGDTIPLKLYTGFIGVQVDTLANMLKASRGYALISYGMQKLKYIAQGFVYIPGKPLHLHETLSITDSMNVYGEKGLLYATHDFNEIEEFAEMSFLDEEYPDLEYRERINLGFGEPNLSINLYREGELIDHLLYYADPIMENLKDRILESLSGYDGAISSLQGAGRWKKKAKIKEFFKQRNIPINGTVDEFAYKKNLPELKIGVNVDTVLLKPGKKIEDIKMSEFKTGIIESFKKTCGWRLERAIYRFYKDSVDLSINVGIEYKNEGRVGYVSAVMEPSENEELLIEIEESIVRYAWMPPKVHSKIGNNMAAQDIVDMVKLNISVSRL